MLNDEELVSEIINGSRAALDMLVRRHYSVVYSYVVRRIGDPHLAYDITQEVFMRMLKGIGSYRIGEGKFANWLISIAVNTCRNYYKSSLHKHMGNEIMLDDTIHSTTNVVYMVEKREEQKEIASALLELPDFQREVIILKIYHEFKFVEIARLTGSSESTVKSRFRQGIGKLKILLERRNENEKRDKGATGKA